MKLNIEKVTELARLHCVTLDKAISALEGAGHTIIGKTDILGSVLTSKASKSGIVKENGVKAVEFLDKNTNKNYHAIEMVFNGVTVRMTDRKWDAIFGAIAAGVLSVGAIKRQAAKIPAPVAKATKQTKQVKSGLVYL